MIQYDIEKKESIKTLIMTLWKRDTEQPTRSEEVALSNAVSLYIERIKQNPLYYMVKPEYQIHVREAIYLDNMLDLF